MESNEPLSRDVLHEDLQILRHTLAAIADDVRRLSSFSAEAVERAIRDLDLARIALTGHRDQPPAAEQVPSPLAPDQVVREKKRKAAYSPLRVLA